MKKFIKFFLIFSVICLIIFLLVVLGIFILSSYMKNSSVAQKYYDRGIDILPEADFIVVPGAKIEGNFPSSSLQCRLDFAIKAYKANKASKIIVSGGFDEEQGKYEALVMNFYLTRLGIPKEDIILDLKGNNTYATLKRIKDYVGDKSVIFCTQELYSARAIYIANHLNLNLNVFCSDAYIEIGLNKKILREYLAQVKAFLNCTIFPPTIPSLEDSSFQVQ